MKSRYEKEENLQHFVKVCGAIAHLPLEDIDKGFKCIEDNYQFDDEDLSKFRIYFLNYIRNFGSMDPFPHQLGIVGIEVKILPTTIKVSAIDLKDFL